MSLRYYCEDAVLRQHFVGDLRRRREEGLSNQCAERIVEGDTGGWTVELDEGPVAGIAHETKDVDVGWLFEHAKNRVRVLNQHVRARVRVTVDGRAQGMLADAVRTGFLGIEAVYVTRGNERLRPGQGVEVQEP